MKRKALLIGAYDDKIPGVKADIRNYYSHLLSKSGGQWHSTEIEILENPSRKLVLEKIGALQYVDYSFVLFGGHGAYSTTERATELVLGGNQRAFDYELMVGADRRTVIIDACRNIPRPSASRQLLKAAMDSLSFSESYINPRAVFENAVMRCQPSITKIHSCNIDESAGDSANGGTYSVALLDAAREWPGTPGSVLTIDAAHARASEWVRRDTGGSQNAQCTSARASEKFPFAIGC